MMERIAMTALLLAAAWSAHAQTPELTVQGAWVRATVQGQVSSGAYMTLTAKEPLVLTGASTPVAARAEVHEMKMDGEIMRMRELDALVLPAGKRVELKPGSYHVMLTQLRAPLQPQTSVPLTLHLRKANGALVDIPLSVPVAASPPATVSAHQH